MMAYTLEKTLAIEAVTRSLNICLRVTNGESIKYIWDKGDGSPVTSMDYAVQAVISKVLSQEKIVNCIIGEEDFGEMGKDLDVCEEICFLVNSAFPESAIRVTPDSIPSLIQFASHKKEYGDRFWVLDPIDGTKGFISKKEFSICLALIEKGQVVLSVIGCPNIDGGLITETKSSGQIYFAVKGQGAYKFSTDRKDEVISIHVNNSVPLDKTVITRSTRNKGVLGEILPKIIDALDIKVPEIPMHSQCKYCLISQGVANLYIRILDPPQTKEMIWDHAPGSLLVEEAGGIVRDFDSKPLDFSCGIKLQNNRGIIASSRNILSHVTSVTTSIKF